MCENIWFAGLGLIVLIAGLWILSEIMADLRAERRQKYKED